MSYAAIVLADATDWANRDIAALCFTFSDLIWC